MEKELETALKELHDPDVEKRLKSVEKLALTRDKRLVRYLVESLGDSDWRVRKSTVSAIINSERDEDLAEQLVAVLYSQGNTAKKNAASEILIGLGGFYLPLIFFHLRSANAEARKFLAEILGEIGSRQATPELIKLLKDPDENVCLTAIDAIGKIRDRTAVESLTPLLKNDSLMIAFAAIKALERIGDPHALESIMETVHTKGLERAAIEAIGTLGDPKALDPIMTVLRQGPYKMREAALRSLIRLYGQVPEKSRSMLAKRICGIYDKEMNRFLMQILEESDDKTKSAAITLLGWVREAGAVRRLAGLLNTPLRDEAMAALIAVGRKAVISLGEELHRGDEMVREGIARVLGELKDSHSVGPLVQLLSDSNGHVREAAALALGKIKDPSSARAVLDLLADRYSSVQESAIEALGYLNSPAIVPRLIEMLTSEKPLLRCHAAKILGKMKAAEAIPQLSFCIKDEDPQVRRIALEALGSFETSQVSPLLILGLGDEDQSVRLTALSVIVKRPEVDLLQHIDPLLTDENIWVRAAAARALGEKRTEVARSLLIGMLKDKVGIVQIASLESLAKFRDPALGPVLYELTESRDVDVVKAAIAAIGEVGGVQYSRELQFFLHHPDWGVRAAAAQTIGKLRDRSARGQLEKLVSTDPDLLVRRSAQDALARIS